MKFELNQNLASLLQGVFYISLVVLVLSLTWNSGWTVAGDPYSLGPYLPWLQLVFPLAGLGLWGLFFSQWALGELRQIHITRWFYLLIFVSLLMLNVIFSVQPESSLGFLSIWLTASLALSLSLEKIYNTIWFWQLYAAGVLIAFVAWWLNPAFIQPDLLALSFLFGLLHVWQQSLNQLLKVVLLALLVLSVTFVLNVPVGIQALVLLGAIFMLSGEYQQYRRKKFFIWAVMMALLVALIGYIVLPALSFKTFFAGLDLGSSFSIFTGVGIGQLEWAQYQNAGVFVPPNEVVSKVSLLGRWWYETGLLMLVLLPSLWLLMLGHGQNFKFRTLLFWGTVFLAPSLWLTPGGIILGAFWFFNRSSWKPANQLSVERDSVSLPRRSNRRGITPR
jgi:hypothetical protein